MSKEPAVRNYRLYTKRVKKFLSLGGVLPQTTDYRNFSYWSPILCGFSCSAMSCVVLNFCLYNIKNLNILTKGMSLACSLIATSLKAACFLIKRNQLVVLDTTLDDLFEEELTVKDEGSRIAQLSLLHTFDKPAYTFSFLIGATLFMYLLPPIILIINQYRHNVQLMTFILPFPGKFPWAISGGGFLYQIFFLYELQIAWFLLFTNSGVDALFGFYIFQMSAILRAMTYQLNNSKQQSLELLHKCIRKHGLLLRCRNILQNVYGPIIIWLVLTNGVVMCALIFQAFQITNITVGKVALFAFYMFLKIVQTFTYAWYGTVLTSESEAFRQGVYFFDWQKNGHLKSQILITMIQRPLTVTASHFFNVSVDMFIKIMNTTMSYFFLLQTLDENV